MRERRNSWKGHVGIFINKLGKKIYILGGNQYNMVCIKPYHENYLIEYRKL